MPQKRPKSRRFRFSRLPRGPWKAPSARTLFTRPAASPQRTLLHRVYLVAGLCVLAFSVLYLDRDGLRDANREVLGIIDLMYFTMVTVATVGYGDIVPVTARARLIDAFFIVPIRIVIWFVFLGTAYQFVIQRVIEEFRMKRLQKQLHDHIVVCGYGLSGSVAVRELLESGFAPDAIIVIDPQQAVLEAATGLGVAGLLGDPAREDLLQQAQVRKAKAVIISVTDDATAILLTLTVRSIAPDTKIVVRIQEQTYQRQLRQAGANVIVSSTKIGGLLLADAVESDYIVPFINDLLSTRGRVTLLERLAEPHEVGCWSNAVPCAVVVGLVRDGNVLSFYEDPPCLIQAGDVLMVIQSARAE
ncbi:potassium channel family protein [Paraburkholderia bonniea]|uniref:potassium channel family protein n=1 Tax=Paraburkholderia bonniea TaxID=2152891 RepID=UPI002573F798|nr:potassium channel family protein [Paraburkholderia bonniea]WJF91552.1 potassium channel family protein [Paraburkholderia bonniea]WJF94871.1 potassium channel family protein [Paraburkholderia bonniea]